MTWKERARAEKKAFLENYVLTKISKLDLDGEAVVVEAEGVWDKIEETLNKEE